VAIPFKAGLQHILRQMPAPFHRASGHWKHAVPKKRAALSMGSSTKHQRITTLCNS
jgi:hypothetical protein